MSCQPCNPNVHMQNRSNLFSSWRSRSRSMHICMCILQNFRFIQDYSVTLLHILCFGSCVTLYPCLSQWLACRDSSCVALHRCCVSRAHIAHQNQHDANRQGSKRHFIFYGSSPSHGPCQEPHGDVDAWCRLFSV